MNAPLSPEAAWLMAELEAGRAPGSDRPMPGSAVSWPQIGTITVCAIGLTGDEQAELAHLAAVSRHRRPHLELLPLGRAHEADVILLDAEDAQARAWHERQDWLGSRSVLWLEHTPTQPGHARLYRPITWSMLPIVLARAVHTAPARTGALALRSAQPSAAVLVLGGEPAVTARLRWLVESTGRRVTVAATAREGLAALHAAPYDCVLLADGVFDLDAPAVCRRVRDLERRLGRVPVLLLEEDPGAWSRMRARLAGFDGVAPLPDDGPAMARLLERHRAEPRPREVPADDPPSTQVP